MMELKFQAEQGEWLCLQHAVKRAAMGEAIQPVMDDFGSEYDFRNTSCVDCMLACEHGQGVECAECNSAVIDLDADAADSAGLRSAIDAVLLERARQDAKWGQQNHDLPYWTSILGEEFGELCQAINETVFDNGPSERAKGGYENMRREAVQVAAVAVAIVEMLDRRYGDG